MHFWIITFFLGTCALVLFPKIPSLYWLLSVLPLLLLTFYVSKNFKTFFTHVLIFVVGFGWALIYAHWITNWSLVEADEGKKILITGYAASLPILKEHYLGFNFQTETIAQEKVNAKLKLSWYGEYPKLLAGDKWQLLVKLKRPHGTLNPGGFDTEKHLLVQHIRATGYVVANNLNFRINSHLYCYPLTRLRQYLIDRMQRVLVSDQLWPVIVALVTGAEHDITQTQWEVMRNTGTSYLVAISGLHIGLVASMVLVLVSYLWRQSKKLPLIMPAYDAGIIAGLLVGFIYGAISGFSIPTQRALIMLIIFSVTALLHKRNQSWNAWLWSLFTVIIIDPLAELTIGFWLSFTAVAAIIYISNWRLKQVTTYLHKFWRMQLTVTLALLPLTLLFFGQFSLVTLLANFFAMPGVCLIVVPISLLGGLSLLFSHGLGNWILLFGAKLLHIIWWWLTLLAQIPNGNWHHQIYNCWILIATFVGILLLLAPRGFPAKYLGFIWLCPLFFYVPAKPKMNEVWFTLLDVGQGLAAVIQTANHVLLYDTGPRFFDYDAGSAIIVPYLRQQGIKTIDTMVVSHGDSDHSGGVAAILRTLKVKNILTSNPSVFTGAVINACVAGQNWQWDGIIFQMISPPVNSNLFNNEASCVLKISKDKNSILLTGDIEKEAEKLLVDNYNTNLQSTILVAPHHGSRTSSTKEFMELVLPQYVLFPTGYRNRFHFPNKKIVTNYTEIGAKLFNTAQTGAITFKFSDKSAIITPSRYREKNCHFWNDW